MMFTQIQHWLNPLWKRQESTAWQLASNGSWRLLERTEAGSESNPSDQRKIDVPFVMHGGSGVSEETIEQL